MDKIKSTITDLGGLFEFLNTSTVWAYIKSALTKIADMLSDKDASILLKIIEG